MLTLTLLRTSSPPKANLDIIKEDPENQITTSKPDAAIVAPVIIKKDLTVEGQDWIDIDAGLYQAQNEVEIVAPL